jgi:hypothetical protein
VCVYINAHHILIPNGSMAALKILHKPLPILLCYIERGELPLVCGSLLA